LKIVAALLPVLIAAATASPINQLRYEIGLDDRHPNRADFTLTVPGEQELALSSSKSAAQPTIAPECGSTPLKQTAPGNWIKPNGCTEIRWSATLSDLDTEPFDGSSPVSGWSRRKQLWLLTSTLPWLRSEGQRTASVRITARQNDRSLSETSKLPGDDSIPIAIVVGKPIRTYSAGEFTINVYGEAPLGAQPERLQHSLASTLADWRRDLFPPGRNAEKHLNYVWFGSSSGSEPGIFASADSDAILIQYIPDPKSVDPDAKLAAGIFGTGAHEAFHALGAVSGAPAWANESLATYFAYAAARRHLKGKFLRLLSELVNAKSEKPLLGIEQAVERGDQSDYGSFYSKGARFWATIDKVLTIKPNGSGKLAALIQQTNGLAGLNWSNADAIAAYLDRYSNGRAGPIVRCYLVEMGCREANGPL
jgi:hypothetical protein